MSTKKLSSAAMKEILSLDAPLSERIAVVKMKRDEIKDIRAGCVHLKKTLGYVALFITENPSHPLMESLLPFERNLEIYLEDLSPIMVGLNELPDFQTSPATEDDLFRHIILGDFEASGSKGMLEDKFNDCKLPFQKCCYLLRDLRSSRFFSTRLGLELTGAVEYTIEHLEWILPKFPFRVPVWNPLLTRTQENAIYDMKLALEDAFEILAPIMQDLKAKGVTLEHIGVMIPEYDPKMIKAISRITTTAGEANLDRSDAGFFFF